MFSLPTRRKNRRKTGGKSPDSSTPKEGARRVFICATFGLFTDGLDLFDEYYEKGYFHKLITTNLVYRSPDLLKRPYYETANMYKYLASIIDCLNHDQPTDRVMSTTHKITRMLEKRQGD